MSNGLEQGIRQGHGFNDVARDARQLVFSHRKSVAAKDNVSDRKRQEAEAARRKHEASKLGFSAGKKRVSIHQLERTNRGKRVEGIAAIQKEVQRSKHVKEKSNLSKRDVKEFLAGPAGLPLSGNAASDEDAGLTWLAASTTGAHGSKKLQTVRSESEQKQARIALQTLPALRTVAQRRLVREIIASVDLFSNLSHREIDSLTELIKVDAFDEGDVIMTEGEPGDEFCIVFSGGVDIIIGGRHVRKAKSHGSRARMYTMRNHNSKQTIKDVGRTRSSTVSHGSIATTASMPPPARPRRNVHDDQPAMLRSRMTKEQLKEWDGVTVGHLNPGATFGELALLDAKGVRTAPTILVAIGRQDFNGMIAKLIQDKTESRLNVLQNHYAFRFWSTERLTKICNFMVPFTFARNTVIAMENTKIKYVFFVSDGTVRFETSVSVDSSHSESTDRAQQLAERRPPRIAYPIYSPRPGEILMDPSVDTATVDLALLGPSSILGVVELSVGCSLYSGSFIASSEVSGYVMKAAEFVNRLDPTTFKAIHDHSKQILNHRSERINTISFAAQERKDFREQEQQEQEQQQQQQPGQSGASVKQSVRPASAPFTRVRGGTNPSTPRRGTLGLYISLGLCPGTIAFPITPGDAKVRDRQRLTTSARGITDSFKATTWGSDAGGNNDFRAHRRKPNPPSTSKVLPVANTGCNASSTRQLNARDPAGQQLQTGTAEAPSSDAAKIKARVHRRSSDRSTAQKNQERQHA